MNVSSSPLDEAPSAPSLRTLPKTSISRRISAPRAGLLMVQLRLTRLRNRLGLGAAGSGRSAGARRAVRASRASWRALAFMLGVGLPALTVYGVILGRFLPWAYKASPHGVIPAASAHLAVSMFAALLLGLGLSNKDLNRLDGDMEWLLTLPASIPLIYTMKIAERTLLDIYSWLQIYPLVLAMVTHGHFSWLGSVQALLLSLPLFLLVALAHVVVECGARVWLPKVLINSLQLVCTVAGLALLLSIPTRPQWVAPLASLPWPALTQAVGLAFSGAVAGDIAPVWRLLRFCAETAALLGGGYALLLYISSRGAVIGAGAAVGRRGRGLQRAFPREFFARGMVKKELLQLARDRRALHVAVVLPAVLVFPLFALSRGSRGELLFSSPTHLPALALLAGILTILCASNLPQADGKALWLLFTLPRPLEQMFFKRALVSLPICTGYAALVLAYGLRFQPLSRELALGAAYSLGGVVLLALIGAALGLSTIDPHAIEKEQSSTRGGLEILLLCVLGAAFTSGLYGDGWLRVSLSVLFAAAAYGVWQDASRRLPFLLEPELRAPARIGVSDGLVCVLLVMLLQQFTERLAVEQLELRLWPARALAFASATLSVGVGATALFQRRGVPSPAAAVGLSWGAGPRVALRQGLLWALPAIAIGLAVAIARRYSTAFHAVSQAAGETLPSLAQPSDFLLFAVLGVIAVPCVEELLFRGMVYRGLRESVSPRASTLVTACAFAAIHPASAAVPAFLVSLLAAAALERSRSLASPLVVHVTYNASVFVAMAVLGV